MFALICTTEQVSYGKQTDLVERKFVDFPAQTSSNDEVLVLLIKNVYIYYAVQCYETTANIDCALQRGKTNII